MTSHPKPAQRPSRPVGVSEPTMEAEKEQPPPTVEGNQEPPASPGRPPSPARAEQTSATLTPTGGGGRGRVCQPWCLLLALTLLLLCLLGSWAVVHLSLGTPGGPPGGSPGGSPRGSPFRVSAGYEQRLPQDPAATIEPHFTTNCTVGKWENPARY